MRFDVTPAVFNGSATAALAGLALGLLLHGAWQSHPGGPQTLFASAAAAELARAPSDQDVIAEQTDASARDADLDRAYLPPAPLPVTRLKPAMFAAAAAPPERQDADTLLQDAGAEETPTD